MAAERAWIGYTDDTGIIFNSYVGAYNHFDFVPFNAARGSLPKQLKMRYVNAQAATTGRKRRVLVGQLTSGLWTGTTTSVNLIDADGSSVSYTITGRVGERWTRLPH